MFGKAAQTSCVFLSVHFHGLTLIKSGQGLMQHVIKQLEKEMRFVY